MDFKSQINNDGYILISNLLNMNELEYGVSSIKDKKVDYTITKEFIDNILLKKIIKNTDFITEPCYCKFRLSNSTDASTFHGDIYNRSKCEIMPIYTCLCYFDDAQMELIPGSHKNNSGFGIESYNKKKMIEVKRGDILIINANIHYRGINYNKTKDCRLLQIFEMFPDKETYDNHFSKLVIVKSDSTMKKIIDPLLYEISKYPSVINFINMIQYILMYNDLHYKIALMDLSPNEKTDRYVSYEPGTQILFNELENHHDLNVNIICDKDVNYVPPGKFYLNIYILYFIASLIFWYIIKMRYEKVGRKGPRYSKRYSKRD